MDHDFDIKLSKCSFIITNAYVGQSKMPALLVYTLRVSCSVNPTIPNLVHSLKERSVFRIGEVVSPPGMWDPRKNACIVKTNSTRAEYIPVANFNHIELYKCHKSAL